MATDDVRTINCPSCGGPIPPFQGDQTRCPFCGTTVLGPEPPKPAIHVTVTPPAVSYPAASRRGCVSPLVVGLAVLLLAGGVALFLFLPSKSSAPGLLVSLSRSTSESAIVVPADRAGPADLLVESYDSTNEERYLSYVDGANHRLLWDSPPVSTDLYLEGVVVRNQMVYLADGTKLLALNQGDGQVAWQTNLADSVTSICVDCVQVVGGYVVVLSQDGTLQAFEAVSGRPAWSKRLNETPRNLWAVNEQVAVVDYMQPNDIYSVAVQLCDPATGDVRQSFSGYCKDEGHHYSYLPIYDPNVVIDPEGQTLTMLHGLVPGCIQQWDLTTGQESWQLWAEDHYLDRFTSPPLLIEGRVYASYSGRIIAVDLEQGSLDILLDEEDYELALQGGREGILIVLARRQRGSTRYELWGVDADSGQVPWKYIPQDEEPIESSGGWAADKAFAWHLTRDGLAVLHVNAEPPTLVVGTIDTRTGQETVLGTAGLDGDYWAGLAWSDSYAWLTIRKVYTIDLVTGKVVGTWP